MLLWAGACAAQTLLTLEEAGARKAPDFSPAHESEVVAVGGTVSARPVEMNDYTYVPIQDATHGLVLEGGALQLSTLRPGDRIEARGTIIRRFGLPVLSVDGLQTLGQGPAPSPRPVGVAELDSFRYLGVLVAIEAKVVEIGEKTGGEFLMIGPTERPLQVFLPLSVRGARAQFSRFRVGDTVGVVGFASQYCPRPPYDHLFEVVVTNPGHVTRLSKRWVVTPELFLAALAALGLVLALWWARGYRVEKQRTIIKTLYRLGEDIIGAGSPPEVLKQIRAVLPAVLKVSGIRLYLHNQATNMLDQVESSPDSKPVSIAVEAVEGAAPAGAAACFRNQALLAIPDMRRSPFLAGGAGAPPMRAAMFVPMLAQGEARGVLEIHDDSRAHAFSPDEQVLAQHLANQVAISLRLMEEQTIREQLSRSERLAAAGQLLSGVATELRAPVEAIAKLTASFLYRRRGPVSEEEMRSIAVEAERASAIVTRLVSFSQSDRAEAKPVELRELLRNLMEFRRREWETRGLEVRDQVGHEPVLVLGSRGQLERVFLNLLIHAEQSLAEVSEKKLTVGVSVLARRALVEISYSAPPARFSRSAVPEDTTSGTGVLIEGVVRGIIQSHGGETRLVRLPGLGSRMEVELPIAGEMPGAAPGLMGEGFVPRLSTVLLVEPDSAVRQKLLALLSRRGYRAVPAGSAEQAAELLQRLRFDLVFCAVSLPGINWVEFFESARRQVGAFVLVTQGFDPELTRGFPEGELHVLPRPIVELELERLLLSLESSAAPGGAGKP